MPSGTPRRSRRRRRRRRRQPNPRAAGPRPARGEIAPRRCAAVRAAAGAVLSARRQDGGGGIGDGGARADYDGQASAGRRQRRRWRRRGGSRGGGGGDSGRPSGDLDSGFRLPESRIQDSGPLTPDSGSQLNPPPDQSHWCAMCRNTFIQDTPDLGHSHRGITTI